MSGLVSCASSGNQRKVDMQRHAFDPISATSGAIFLVAGVIALTDTRGWSLLQSGRLWAVLVLIGGVAVLVAALASTGSHKRDESGPSALPPIQERSTQPATPYQITDVELAIQELAAERQEADGRPTGDPSSGDPAPPPPGSDDEVNLEGPPSDDRV